MKVNKENSVVSIEYTVKSVETNEVVDSNVGREPLMFITGKTQIINGLEEALIGMEVMNENDAPKEILVTPENAYGESNQEAIQTLPAEQFADIKLEKGMMLYGNSEDGQQIQVTVRDFNENEVTVDYNHPLAGQTLLFTTKVLAIREATKEEISTGIVGGQDGCCGDDSEHNHGGCGCS